MGVQIGSGVLLAMHYKVGAPIVSVGHIGRDVMGGWWLRGMHGMGATMVIGCLYVHMGRGLYYGSYVGKRGT